jgi:hypothetical protein
VLLVISYLGGSLYEKPVSCRTASESMEIRTDYIAWKPNTRPVSHVSLREGKMHTIIMIHRSWVDFDLNMIIVYFDPSQG